MSATCPKCGNSIEQDFGVAACTSCEAVLFIDMDGNAQLAEESAPEEIEAPQGLDFPASEAKTMISANSDSPFQELEMPAFDPAPVVQDMAAPVEMPAVEMNFDQSVEQSFEPSVVEMDVEENTQPMASQGEDAAEEPVLPPITEEQIQSLAEIEPEGTGVFESTEQVLGGLSYSVTIRNIDTKEIRKQLIEALDDARFQWDPREVLKTVKAGTLELKNLNPVKASVVVQRMKDLSVKVSWEQHVYN